MIGDFQKRSMAGLLVGTALVCCPALAHAQAAPAQAQAPAPAQAAAPAETADAPIVVTARFTDTRAESATKLPIAVLDTPYTVDSYNGKFLKAIETTNVADLYKYMTGIQRAGNTGYDITFRGFKTSGNDRNAILTDGLPGLSVRFGSPPTVGVDHIELVKGATSVLYGQAQPGGFINNITKKPLFHEANEIQIRATKGAGTFDRQAGATISFDSTGPLNSAGTLAYRFVGETGFTSGFRTFSDDQPIYAAPSLSWKPGSGTLITIQGEYRRVKTQYDTYLVTPNRDVSLLPRIDTIYQEPGDYLLEEGKIGSLYVKQDITNWLKLNISYRYVDHKDSQYNYDVVGFLTPKPATATPTTLTRRARGQINKRTYNFVDANLVGKFETFGLHHTILAGVNGGEETASLDRTQFYDCTAKCTSLNISIYNPVYGVAPPLSSFPLDTSAKLANLTWRYTTQKSLGLYTSDLIEIIPQLKVLVGVRYANERQTIEDLRNPQGVTRKTDQKTLPLAGVIIEPTKQISFYASYSTGFVPQAAASFDVFGLNPFKPTTAKAYEIGFKTELFDHHLSFNGAYFDIHKDNTLNSFRCPTLAQINAGIANGTYVVPANAPRDAAGNLIPASGTCSAQIGSERSRGIELEVNASPAPGWTVTGGFAHTEARITQSNLAYQVGARETNSPENAANFWSRYDFTKGTLNGFGVGLGVSYIGKRAGLLPTQFGDTRPENGTLPLPAYTTVDLGLYYKASNALDFTLKATNLFDKRYIESAGFTADINLLPGAPRYLTLTGRFRF